MWPFCATRGGQRVHRARSWKFWCCLRVVLLWSLPERPALKLRVMQNKVDFLSNFDFGFWGSFLVRFSSKSARFRTITPHFALLYLKITKNYQITQEKSFILILNGRDKREWIELISTLNWRQPKQPYVWVIVGPRSPLQARDSTMAHSTIFCERAHFFVASRHTTSRRFSLLIAAVKNQVSQVSWAHVRRRKSEKFTNLVIQKLRYRI